MRRGARLLLVLAILAIPACTRRPASGGPVTIVLEAPLTGAQSSTGIDMWDGAELAVDQANAHGGVLGKWASVTGVAS